MGRAGVPGRRGRHSTPHMGALYGWDVTFRAQAGQRLLEARGQAARQQRQFLIEGEKPGPTSPRARCCA